LQYLLYRGGRYLQLLQLMDELLVPGTEKGRAEARNLPNANREERVLRDKCIGQIDYMEARRWTFFALAALYFPGHRDHGIFRGLRFFQNEEAVR